MSDSPPPPPSAPPPPPPASGSSAQQQSQQHNSHAPLIPSGLRQSHHPESSASSPDEERHSLVGSPPGSSALTTPAHNASPLVELDDEDAHHGATTHAGAVVGESTENPARASLVEPPDGSSHEPNDAVAKLASILPPDPHVCGDENCDHGTLSPRAPTLNTPHGEEDVLSERLFWAGGDAGRPDSASSSVRERLGRKQHQRGYSGSVGGGSSIGGGSSAAGGGSHGGGNVAKSVATQHRGRGKKSQMYLAYYFPFFNWIRQYRWSFLKGDFVAALTMASFYIPMALSYAANLGHLPPINGLYAFSVNPLIYAFLGTSPQMVVGPEAAGSLLVGSVVRSSVDKGHSTEDEGMMHARIAGVVTGMAGAMILLAGVTRLGFIDSVLSRPFLRGFISAIGVVILADQLIPEMGLADLAKQLEVDHGSSVQKVVFLVQHVAEAHWPTTLVSFVSFTITMICRQTKLRLQPRRPSVAYIPDRFLIVVFSAVLAYTLDWEQYGIEVLGDVRSGTGAPFPVHFPFVPSYMKHVREAMSTSFLIALLGFFESSVAAKSLGGGEKKEGEGIRGVALSPNRELVALGVANMAGGFFMALPAFGGYGRSKVNKQTGGKTPMSSIFLSLFTIFCVFFLLPWFYYLPKAVLCALVSVVAYSLIEEAPEDLRFFLRIRGWSDLALMATIFLATIFYSLPLGIALGMGISILEVIRHATKPRIQILGKVPGTINQFENAETNPHDVEFVEGCLIVKIPEPLTFANTGQLKNRLRRLELYGTTAAHPALPRVRAEEHNQNVIFDVHGVTGMDGSGAQVLVEIVDEYVEKGVRVFFSRVPSPRSEVFKKFVRSGIVEKCGGPRHFVKSVDEALALALETHEEAAFRDQDDPPV